MSFKYAMEQLFYYQYGRALDGYPPDNFHSLLYVLFQKADGINREKLASGFPDEAMAFRMWHEYAGNQDSFFREHGLDIDRMLAERRKRAKGGTG